jgi:hypothetical protein
MTASQSANGVQSASVKSNRWIAERIRRTIAALKPDLMGAISVRKGYPKHHLPTGQCPHCASYHSGRCPVVKAIEYFNDGRVKRVEYHDPMQYSPQHAYPYHTLTVWAGDRCMPSNHGAGGNTQKGLPNVPATVTLVNNQ